MGIILFSGCSVTKHLPEGEVLYTGGKLSYRINRQHR